MNLYFINMCKSFCKHILALIYNTFNYTPEEDFTYRTDPIVYSLIEEDCGDVYIIYVDDEIKGFSITKDIDNAITNLSDAIYDELSMSDNITIEAGDNCMSFYTQKGFMFSHKVLLKTISYKIIEPIT